MSAHLRPRPLTELQKKIILLLAEDLTPRAATERLYKIVFMGRTNSDIGRWMRRSLAVVRGLVLRGLVEIRDRHDHWALTDTGLDEARKLKGN